MSKIKNIYNKIKSIEFLPLIFAFILISIFFTIKSPYFFTFNNFMGIILYAAIVGIVSLSNCLVLSAGKIDFSVGSTIALGSCVMGIMMRDGYSVWAAMGVCFLIGIVVGVYNGVMIAYVKMNPFIATLAGMQMLRGFAYLLTDARSIPVSSDVLKFIGRARTLGVPNAAWIMIILLFVFLFIVRYTSYGRRIFVIGGSETVAYLSGINVKRDLLILFIIHGVITAIASIIYTAQLGAALHTAAQNTNFDAISGCVLGGVSLSGGKGSLVGGIIGVLMLQTLSNGMNMIGVSSFWQDVITGFVLIFAVGLDIYKNTRKSRVKIA